MEVRLARCCGRCDRSLPGLKLISGKCQAYLPLARNLFTNCLPAGDGRVTRIVIDAIGFDAIGFFDTLEIK